MVASRLFLKIFFGSSEDLPSICRMEQNSGKTPTELEKEIVKYLGEGYTASQVAKIGGTSKKAMESRILRLRLQWGLKSVSALCLHFMRKGWIT